MQKLNLFLSIHNKEAPSVNTNSIEKTVSLSMFYSIDLWGLSNQTVKNYLLTFTESLFKYKVEKDLHKYINITSSQLSAYTDGLNCIISGTNLDLKDDLQTLLKISPINSKVYFGNKLITLLDEHIVRITDKA